MIHILEAARMWCQRALDGKRFWSIHSFIFDYRQHILAVSFWWVKKC